jgi:hypothetical protein
MEGETTLTLTVLQATRTGLAATADDYNNKNNNSEYCIYCTSGSADIKVANILNLHQVPEENGF